MLHVRLEFFRPGIDHISQVHGIIGLESVLQNTDLTCLPSGAQGTLLESEIDPQEVEVIPQVELQNFTEQDASLHKSFSVKEKREYILAIDDLIARGASHRQACAMVNLPHNYYPCFKKVIKKIDDLDNAGFVPFKTNGTA